jgi:hypothetical protein
MWSGDGRAKAEESMEEVLSGLGETLPGIRPMAALWLWLNGAGV